MAIRLAPGALGFALLVTILTASALGCRIRPDSSAVVPETDPGIAAESTTPTEAPRIAAESEAEKGAEAAGSSVPDNEPVPKAKNDTSTSARNRTGTATASLPSRKSPSANPSNEAAASSRPPEPQVLKPPPPPQPPLPARPPQVEEPKHASSVPPTGERSIDLAALKVKLRDTPAIGFFTKLELKNQIDALVADFRRFHQSIREPSPEADAELVRLRSRFDGLLLKVLVILESSAPELHREVSDARGAVWQSLVDPISFARI